ncbi:MAG: DUF4340 domain-containing protein [Luteitalea sp.]
MTRGRSALILLLLAAGLGAYIWFVEMKRPDPDAEPKADRVFASLDASQISELTLQAGNGDVTTLNKQGTEWRIATPVVATADASEVSGVTTNLATLDISRVISESSGDLASYGLDRPRLRVRFTTKGTPQELLIGSKTVTGGDVYAKLANAARVFLVPAFLEQSLDRTTFQLRDKAIVSVDREAIDRISIIGRPGTIELTRDGENWRLIQPVAARADSSAVSTLLTRLVSGQMQALVAEQPATLDVYGLQPPRTTVRVLGGGRTLGEVQVGDPSGEGAVHARDSARKMVFTVEAALATDLQRPANEYRARELFAFQPFTVTQIVVTRGDASRTFQKRTTGTGAAATDAWAQTSPTDATVTPATIDDLVSKLSAARAESFTAAPRSTSAPILTVAATSAGSAQERVSFVRDGAQVLAVRDGEPGAALVETATFEGIVALLDRQPSS